MHIQILLKLSCVSVFLIGTLTMNTSSAFSGELSAYSGWDFRTHIEKPKSKKKDKPGANLSFPAYELDEWKLRQGRSTKDYERRVFNILTGNKKLTGTDVTTIRHLYPLTPYYDPFGTNIIERMTHFAYIADTSDNPKEINEALKEYRDLLCKHLANLDVVDYALTLSKAKPRYGDEVLLKAVRDALLEDVKGTKIRGKTPDSAYVIVTYGEEIVLLNNLDAKVEKSKIYEVNKKFYNVHDVVYKDGRHSQLYIDLTNPIYLYEKTQALREKENRISIPLQ
ncbi:MAG: hypothetical protein KAJ40_01855 [Alphaproteobacteria bacterium]|nr:hypothetical protein [Alphaproteobacteria bacterium]